MAKKKRSNYGNYLAEFYDGKLSLPHSYWIFGLVYSILVGILLAVLVIFNLVNKTRIKSHENKKNKDRTIDLEKDPRTNEYKPKE